MGEEEERLRGEEGRGGRGNAIRMYHRREE